MKIPERITVPKELRPYQIKDLTFNIQQKRCLNLSEPATGKTGPSCVMTRYVRDYEDRSSIFLMPKSLLLKNAYELMDFAGWEPNDLAIFDDPARKWKPKSVDVVLTTADTLARHPDKIREICRRPVGLAQADEIHLYYSSHNTKRTQGFYHFMRNVPRFIGMTGTLIRGRLTSAYPSIHLIEPRYYGTPERFEAEHAIRDEWTGEVIGWTNMAKLGHILIQHSVNHTFAECYGKEKKVIISIPIQMDEKHRKAYDEFHDLAMLELDDGNILYSEQEGVHLIRCRQLLAHPESLGIKLPLAKDLWLEEEILNDYKTGLIFSALKPEQLRIQKMLEDRGLKVGLINGDVSLGRRAKIDQDYQDGKLDWIIASPATAGIGFNWGRAECVVFLTPDYMDDSFMQAYRRAIRGIREIAIPIYLPQYAKTIENRIYGIIERKSRLAADVDRSREPLSGLIA